MKGRKRILSALASVVGAGLLALPCSEGSVPTSAEEVPGIPQFAFQNCLAWSCESGRCGYDTARPPGACCISRGNAFPVPKPNCGGGQCGGMPGPWCDEPKPRP